MHQAETYSLPVNTSWQQTGFTGYFADAGACRTDDVAGLVDNVAGFADAVSRRPDNDRCRRDKHNVFTDNGLR
jgi:hypothetical protein